MAQYVFTQIYIYIYIYRERERKIYYIRGFPGLGDTWISSFFTFLGFYVVVLDFLILRCFLDRVGAGQHQGRVRSGQGRIGINRVRVRV